MERSLRLIVLFFLPLICDAQGQPVTVDDLISLSTLSPKNFDNYMEKKGYLPGNRSLKDNAMAVTFFEKRSFADSNAISRTVEVYRKEDTYCFVLETSSKDEYSENLGTLKRMGFFYDNNNKKDSSKPAGLMFQKGNLIVFANELSKEGELVYSLLLEKKVLPNPGNIQFAEDLLKFDSHEHLTSFFGEQNVAKDIYYVSERESVNCSVLFPNSSRQVVFIWDDPVNLYKISFVVISGTITTAGATSYSGNIGQNTWKLRNGIHSGMRIKDLLKLNVIDFKFYGRSSEYSFMVVPEKTKYIDFTGLGIMLGCFNCNGASLLDAAKVSAEEATRQELALYVSCIMISPE